MSAVPRQLHVRRRQAQEPAVGAAGVVDGEPVGEAGVPGHRDDVVDGDRRDRRTWRGRTAPGAPTARRRPLPLLLSSVPAATVRGGRRQDRGVEISCALNCSSDSPEHARIAEDLGYTRVWIYDSPALYTDVWVQLCRAAERTVAHRPRSGRADPVAAPPDDDGGGDLDARRPRRPGAGDDRRRHRLHRPADVRAATAQVVRRGDVHPHREGAAARRRGRVGGGADQDDAVAGLRAGPPDRGARG